MNVQKRDLPKRQIELSIELTADEFQPYLMRAAERISKEVKIDGFRPGKVPYDVLKKKVGEQAISEEASQDAVRKSYVDAVIQEKLDAVGAPDVRVTKLAPGNPFTYTAVVALMPDVTLGDISSMKTKKQEVVVTDVDVAGTIDELRKMRSTEKLVLRASAKGDKVELDFTISKNNMPIEGGSGTKYPLVLGEGRFLPDFETAILGMSAGEEKMFQLTFPKDYFNQKLRGQAHVVKLKVLNVYKIQIPEADDAFAKTVGDFANLEALKTAIRDNIKREKETKATEKFDSDLLQELVGKSTFGEMPDVLVAGELTKMLEELKTDITSKGMSYETYLSNLGKTEEDLKKGFEAPAELRVKTGLAIREVIKADQLTVTDEELNTELEKVKRIYAASEEAAKQIQSNSYRNYLANVLVNRKVVEKLRKAAEVS
ncbi:MAG: trigger factor [Candidatus Kerfeldbacteria bacterium]|nr:trigger factor [Candidatus Kerfeldbacteria bacterium]